MQIADTAINPAPYPFEGSDFDKREWWINTAEAHTLSGDRKAGNRALAISKTFK